MRNQTNAPSSLKEQCVRTGHPPNSKQLQTELLIVATISELAQLTMQLVVMIADSAGLGV